MLREILSAAPAVDENSASNMQHRLATRHFMSDVLGWGWAKRWKFALTRARDDRGVPKDRVLPRIVQKGCAAKNARRLTCVNARQDRLCRIEDPSLRSDKTSHRIGENRRDAFHALHDEASDVWA